MIAHHSMSTMDQNLLISQNLCTLLLLLQLGGLVILLRAVEMGVDGQSPRARNVIFYL